MTLEFESDWTDDHSDQSLLEEELRIKITDCITGLVTTDGEFSFLKTAVAAATVFKAKVTKGLHQEEGNQLIPERHVTLEVPDYPYPKRFHLYFWRITKKVGKKKVLGWHPCRLTYFDYSLDRELKSVSL